MNSKFCLQFLFHLFYVLASIHTVSSQSCQCQCQRSVEEVKCQGKCGSRNDTEVLPPQPGDNLPLEPIIPAEPNNPFKFQSGPVITLHQDFMKKAMNLIIKNGLGNNKKIEKLSFLSPEKLRKAFDFTLGEDGVNQDQILSILDKLFEVTAKPGPMNRLSRRVAGLDPLALVGDWMAATMSNLVVTYQCAPLWTLMEIALTKYLSKQIGWDKIGDGVPTSGAGVANSMAMAVAIRNFDKNIRDIGLSHVKKMLTVYVSAHASISWKTAAIYDGLGLESIIEVPVNEWGQMDVQVLGNYLESDKNGKGSSERIPIMVVATAGTPILGVIDPIDEIATLCEKYKVWLHIDAELAGGYLFTAKNSQYQNRLRGINRSDSVSISMWLFQVPYPNSMLLTKNVAALENSFGLHASYVFTGIDNYNMSYDKGDHTIQTSRRPEVSKIWFAASRGEAGTLELFDVMEKSKKDFYDLITSPKYKDKFRVIQHHPPAGVFQVPLLSFHYVPAKCKNRTNDPAFVRTITACTNKLSHELHSQGLLDISMSKLPDTTIPQFLTISFTNARIQSNLDLFNFILNTIDNIGQGKLTGHELPNLGEDPPSEISFPNFPHVEIYHKFFIKIFDLVFNSGIFFNRTERVNDLQQPAFFESTSENFDLTLPYSDDGNLLDKLFTQSQRIIRYSPHWAHPYFIYQLAAGLDPYTLIADYISPILNTPMIGYTDGSAPFMMMERELVKMMVKRIYHKDDGDGIITDGGSMGNQIPIAMAKYHLDKEGFKTRGYRLNNGKKYIVYTSGDAHYSTKKGSIFQGIGQNNTMEVESNDIGQMKVNLLKEAIAKTKKEGDIPLLVVITTGTTIYGAIDPINDIVDVCEAEGIWCHVDGMFGGLIALSDTHIKLYPGIERTNSWGADLHKLFGSTMVCTILITPFPGYFNQVFKLPDESQAEGFYEHGTGPELNLVGRHAQLDKRNNVFKFWLLWKAKGRKGLEAHVDTIMRNKDIIIAEIKKRNSDGFELMIDNFELTNICFIYIPPHLNPTKTPGVKRDTEEWIQKMDQFTFSIEKEFLRNGIISFVTQSRHLANDKQTTKFIKFVMMGSALTLEDIQFLLDAIVYYGNQITPSTKSLTTDELNVIHDGRFDPFGSIPRYYKVTD